MAIFATELIKHIDMERIFKRKLYDRLLEWKRVQGGKSAIMIEGARRVGKSTLVEQFAKTNMSPISSSTSMKHPMR